MRRVSSRCPPAAIRIHHNAAACRSIDHLAFSRYLVERLAASEVFLNAGWQSRAWTPVVPISVNNPKNASPIDTWAVIPIAAPGVFAFASLAGLIAMDLAVLLVSLAVSLDLPRRGPGVL